MAAQTGGGTDPAEQAVRKLLYGADGGVLAGLAGGRTGDGHAGDAAAGGGGRRAAPAPRPLRLPDVQGRGHRTARWTRTRCCAARGHWYLVGRDPERDAVRAFRLSRFTSELADAGEGSEPPDGFRAADHVMAGPWGVGEPSATATVAFAPDVVWWATAGLPGAAAGEPHASDGWTEVTLPLGDVAELGGWVLQFGPDADASWPPTSCATRSWPGSRRSVPAEARAARRADRRSAWAGCW